MRVAALLAATLVLAFLMTSRPWRYVISSGPSRNGVASITAVTSGVRGRHTGSYSYRVRLDDGTEADMTLPEVFSPGTRLRLAYNRGWRSQLNVFAYQVCASECVP